MTSDQVIAACRQTDAPLSADLPKAAVAGEIRFAGDRIDGKATEDIARLGVARVPDGRGTFLDLTVEENLRLEAFATDFDRLRGY